VRERLRRAVARRLGLLASPMPRATDGITAAHVEWGYRLFLDREPENEEVVRGKVATNRSTRSLRLEFLGSHEFLTKNPEFGRVPEGHVVIAELPEGLRLFVDVADVVVGMGIVRGAYEGEELAYMRRVVGPGDVVVDAGANVGLFTVTAAAAVGPTGHVHAFEPQDDAAALLERSVAENRFGDRVTVHRAALGDAPGRVSLVVQPAGLSRGGAHITPAGGVPDGWTARPVDVIRLDDAGVRRPVKFVKLDVEGAELLVARGAQDLLRADRPVVMAEINPRQLGLVSGCSAEQLVAEFADLGYRATDLGGDPAGAGDQEGRFLRTVVFSPVD